MNSPSIDTNNNTLKRKRTSSVSSVGSDRISEGPSTVMYTENKKIAEKIRNFDDQINIHLLKILLIQEEKKKWQNMLNKNTVEFDTSDLDQDEFANIKKIFQALRRLK